MRCLNDPAWPTPPRSAWVPCNCSERLVGTASGDVLWLVKMSPFSPHRREAVRTEGVSDGQRLSSIVSGVAEEP